MRILLTILFLLITVNAWSVPPSRDNTYVSGETIKSADVTANEDVIFNYLQAGVDKYADGSIVNADVNASAGIQSDKLTLTAIAQDVAITSAGSFDNNGATTLDGTVAITGALTNTAATTLSGDVTLGDGTDDTLTINSDDGITFTPAATWTFTGDQTVSGTWTDLGTVTTANIDGGTLDGVQVDGATTTGTVWYNDSNDDIFALVPGADNTVLTSTGTSSAPAWEVTSVASNVIFTWSGVDNFSSANRGFYTATTIDASGLVDDDLGYALLATDSQSAVTLLNFQYVHTASIATITIHGRLFSGANGAGQETIMTVDIGGQSNTVKTTTSTTATWVTTSTIDVSGLTPGTVYNGIVQLNNEENNGTVAYCSAVTLVAS